MSKSDDQWRIEDDARTLIRAAEIKLDKPRYRKALVEVKKQAKAATQTASAAASVADQGTTK